MSTPDSRPPSKGGEDDAAFDMIDFLYQEAGDAAAGVYQRDVGRAHMFRRIAERLRSSTERVASESDREAGLLLMLEQAENEIARLRERVAPGEQRIDGWATYDGLDWIQVTPEKPKPDGIMGSVPCTLIIHNAGASVPEPAERLCARCFIAVTTQVVPLCEVCTPIVLDEWGPPSEPSAPTRPEIREGVGVLVSKHERPPIFAGADVEGPSEPAIAPGHHWHKMGLGQTLRADADCELCAGLCQYVHEWGVVCGMVSGHVVHQDARVRGHHQFSAARATQDAPSEPRPNQGDADAIIEAVDCARMAGSDPTFAVWQLLNRIVNEVPR